MNFIDDLWTVYKACLMLGTLVNSIQKNRHRPPSKHENNPDGSGRPFLLGGIKWPSQTYRTTQRHN